MSLIVFLKLVGVKSKSSLGTLQIYHQVGPQGQVSQGWEWIGINATVDGGYWEWKKDNDSGKVRAELTSTTDPERKRIIASLFNILWNKGSIPPNVPWFYIDPYEYATEPETLMEYYGPSGNTKQYARWYQLT